MTSPSLFKIYYRLGVIEFIPPLSTLSTVSSQFIILSCQLFYLVAKIPHVHQSPMYFVWQNFKPRFEQAFHIAIEVILLTWSILLILGGWVGMLRNCYKRGTLGGIDESNGCRNWTVDGFAALFCFCDTDACNTASRVHQYSKATGPCMILFSLYFLM